jgi:hypothetical protein
MTPAGTPGTDNLVAGIIQHNYNQYADTSQYLIGSLTRQLAEAKAVTDCIRNSVEVLLAGPYAPSEHMIRRALYPDKEYVKTFLPEGES